MDKNSLIVVGDGRFIDGHPVSCLRQRGFKRVS